MVLHTGKHQLSDQFLTNHLLDDEGDSRIGKIMHIPSIFRTANNPTVAKQSSKYWYEKLKFQMDLKMAAMVHHNYNYSEMYSRFNFNITDKNKLLNV